MKGFHFFFEWVSVASHEIFLKNPSKATERTPNDIFEEITVEHFRKNLRNNF